uniref:Fibronectin type-III domain-containing protein n=1 Tax=uncultured Latescibacterota bacterium TaxID=199737 RepID=Q2YZW4_9BACT|nr:hypothetical protein [uncultured Latescibacterota bacterium]
MGQNIRVTARVTDPDSGDVVTEVHLEVSRMGPPMSFPMWLDPATGDYVGDIPGHEVMPPGFDYRVVSNDAQGHVRANPRFQNPPYWVEVGYGGSGGGARPEITFAPLASPKPPWQDVTVSATVTDPDGDIREVGIEINRPGMPPMFFPLNPTGMGAYQGRIFAGDVQPPGFNYRIVARDMNFNETATPAFNYDPYWVDVSGGGTTQGNPPQITHTPVPSPKPMNQNILVTATVTDPDSNDTVTDVHLEVLHGGPPMHFPMQRDAATGTYTGQIPGPEVMAPGFEYRVVAKDNQGNVKAKPVFSQAAYWVDVSWGGGGGSKPEITHTRLPSPQAARHDIEVTAMVTDPDGDLMMVGIEVNRPNSPPTFYPMDPMGAGQYRGRIFGGDVQRPGFSYRIVAEDMTHNRRGNPFFNFDPFWVDVGAGQGLPPNIVHSPIPGPVVPNQNIRVTATVTDPDADDAVAEVWVELQHGGPPMRFPLFPDTIAGAFTGTIPGNEVWEPGFEYRVFAEDGNGNIVSKPSFEYPSYWVDAFRAGGEGLRPVITHAPLGGPLPPRQEVYVTATVTDEDGDLREVRLEISRPGMPPTSLPMMDEGGGSYGGTIWPMAVEFPGFEYRIIAEDQAYHMASNPGPSYPPYWVGVSQGTGGVGGEPPIITHRVLPSPQEPNRPIEVTCTVADRDSLDEIWGVALEIHRPGRPPLDLPMATVVRTDSTGTEETYYLGRINGMEVQRPGFGYRIKAMDTSGMGTMMPQPHLEPYWIDVQSGGDAANAPEITHTKIASPQPQWTEVRFRAKVTDLNSSGQPDRPDRVFISFDSPTMRGEMDMAPLGPANPDMYEFVVPPGMLMAPGFGYRIMAWDRDGNESANPKLQFDPYWIDVGYGTATGAAPSIAHSQVPSPQTQGTEVLVTATVSDHDTTDSVDHVDIEITSPGRPPFWFPMVYQGTAANRSGTYTVAIPSFAVNPPGFEYRIHAGDDKGVIGAKPALSYPPYWVDVTPSGVSGLPPTIDHRAIPFAGSGDELRISAVVSPADASAEGSAIAEVRVKCFHPTTNRGIEFPMPLLETVGTGARYEAVIPPDFVSTPGFEYRIVAKDASNRQAQKPKPQERPYWVEVRGFSQAPTITHSVVTSSVKGQPVPIGARIQDDRGVSSARIHVFRPDGRGAEFPMVRGVGDEYNATIPGNLVSPPGFSYFIEAQDVDHMMATSPLNPTSPYVVPTLGAAGGVPPKVTIFSIDRGSIQSGTAVEVRATITDPDSTGGLSASLSCKAMNDFSPPVHKPMQPSATDPSVFIGTIPAEIVAAPGFNYAVEAKDRDANMTIKPIPPSPPYFVDVLSGIGDPPTVMHRPPMQVPENQAVTLLAQVSDGDGIDQVFLQYLPHGSTTQTPVRVNFNDYGNGSYGCVLPAEVMRRPGLEYRILARDTRGDIGLSPEPPEFSHFLEVGFSGGAGARPEVFHQPMAQVTTGNRIRVDAEVRDADSRDLDVTLFYEDRRGNFEEKELPMNPVHDETTGLLVYRADIPGEDVLAPGLVYWIEAADPEGNETECPMPPAPPFYVRVMSGGSGIPPKVVHDPVLSAPAATSLVITAEIEDADGVASARLAYVPAAEVDNDTTHVEPYWVPMTAVPAKDGTYSATIPADNMVAPGVFYVISARDAAGDEILYPEYPADPLFVSVNSTLTVREPQDHAATSQATIAVLGSDTGGVATVNGEAVTEWTDTNFQYTVTLREGQNVIVVGGSDGSEIKRRVTRTSQAPAEAVVLLKPGSGKEISSSKVLFSWQALPKAARYLFQASAGERFAVLAESLLVADNLVTVNGLTDGRWFWRVKAYDAAGNAFQRWSETREFVVNTRILPPPQIDIAALQSSANQSEVSITGTSRPGSYVTVYVHGASLNQSVLNTDLTVRTPGPTGTDGIFRIPGVRLFQGTNEMVACAKDSVAVSAMSDKVVVHHDNTVPRAPFLENVSGATLEGLAEPGVTVEVYLDAVGTTQAEMNLNGTTTSDATNGRFSYRINAVDGTYTLLLRSRDPSGNTGEKSLLQISPFVLDTIAPAIPTIATPATGVVLRSMTVDVVGTAAAGDARRVAIWVNGREYGRADVDAEGGFNAPSIVLAAGSNVVQAKARDRYNNWSPLSDSIHVELNTGGISISDLSPADLPATLYRNESLIHDATPMIQAVVAGSEHVRVRIDGGSWNTVDVPVAFESPGLADGGHRYEIEATTSSDTAFVTIPFVVDTAAPALANLVISEGDSLTNDAVPLVRFDVSDTGVGVDRRGVVLQFNGSAVRDQQNIVVEETGGVSYMPAASLGDGVYSISATASDQAGNAGNTLTGSLRIDTKPPMLMIAVTPPFADDFSIPALRGRVFILVFADERLAETPEFAYESSDGEAGSFVLDGPSHDERSGLWYYTYLYDPSTFGGLMMQAVGEDLAGNTGVAMETFVLQDVPPEDGGTVRHEDGIVVIIPVGATGDTVAVSITPEQEEVDNQKMAFMKSIQSKVLSGAGVKATCESSLTGQLGKIYSFGPEGMEFGSPIDVALSYAAYSNSTRTSKLGLYTFDDDLCSWVFVSNEVDADSKKVTGSVTHFSRFALAMDESAPTVTLVTPTSESIVQATVPVELAFSDNVSGIDLASLSFKVDGTAIDLGHATLTDSSFAYTVAFADLGIDHTATFSVSDNQGNLSTKSLTFVTTPGLTIGVAQNPIITSELDIYVVSSAELLENSLEVEINGSAVPMTLTDAANQVYRGDYQIPSGGTLAIAATAEDLLGNPLTRDKTLGVKRILASQPGWAASPGGELVAHFEEGTVENDFYLLVVPLDTAPANLQKAPRMAGLAPPAGPTTAVGTAYELSPASVKLNRAVRLEFSYAEEALGKQPADNLSIFHWDGAAWQAVDTDVNRTARTLTARVHELGVYQMRLDPAIGVLRGPACFALHPNYPNPFNPATVIMFDVPVRTEISLRVFNVRGQLVKTLVSEELPPGTHYVRWDGTNNDDRPVASGVYFYRMDAEDYQKTQKMILLK